MKNYMDMFFWHIGPNDGCYGRFPDFQMALALFSQMSYCGVSSFFPLLILYGSGNEYIYFWYVEKNYMHF